MEFMKNKSYRISGILFVILNSFTSTYDYVFSMPPVVTNGQLVGTVACYDPDNVNNPGKQTLKYSIVSGNTNTSFKIGAYTGILTVNNATYINGRTKKYFDLVIKVCDNGIPMACSTATVHVITKK